MSHINHPSPQHWHFSPLPPSHYRLPSDSEKMKRFKSTFTF